MSNVFIRRDNEGMFTTNKLSVKFDESAVSSVPDEGCKSNESRFLFFLLTPYPTNAFSVIFDKTHENGRFSYTLLVYRDVRRCYWCVVLENQQI